MYITMFNGHCFFIAGRSNNSMIDVKSAVQYMVVVRHIPPLSRLSVTSFKFKKTSST